jgi:hypothetical protein
MRRATGNQIVVRDDELAGIITALLKNPDDLGEMFDMERHRRFAEALAQVVADECGGDISLSPDGKLTVTPNDSSPEGGGVWSMAGEARQAVVAPYDSGLRGLLSALERDLHGGFSAVQESIAAINVASALVASPRPRLQGCIPDDAEVNGFSREAWEQTGGEESYEGWVEDQLRGQYRNTRASLRFGANEGPEIRTLNKEDWQKSGSDQSYPDWVQGCIQEAFTPEP